MLWHQPVPIAEGNRHDISVPVNLAMVRSLAMIPNVAVIGAGELSCNTVGVLDVRVHEEALAEHVALVVVLDQVVARFGT